MNRARVAGTLLAGLAALFATGCTTGTTPDTAPTPAAGEIRLPTPKPPTAASSADPANGTTADSTLPSEATEPRGQGAITGAIIARVPDCRVERDTAGPVERALLTCTGADPFAAIANAATALGFRLDTTGVTSPSFPGGQAASFTRVAGDRVELLTVWVTPDDLLGTVAILSATRR